MTHQYRCVVVFLLAVPSFLLPATKSGNTSIEPAHSPNLLIITLDTTRADHLGCYGMKNAKTPVLDALASRGALFEEAHSHVPLTLPSHAVLLTSQLPSTLNLRINGLQLKKGVETLATHLKARGYWTGAVVASVMLNREYGLARGFEVYDDHMTLPPKGGTTPEERRAGEVTETALTITNGIPKPFFLWVHYYDPHYEYRPPEPYATEFKKDLYDGEIAYMDASIGQLLEGLKKRGLLDNTVIAVAGDHGEGLMEHGERQHGIFLYEYALHVPLLLMWNGHIRPGSRIPNLCGLSDVAPTVLDLMGQGSLPKSDGVSLAPLLRNGQITPRRLYAESYHGFFTYGWAPERASFDERWKLIEAPNKELYQWPISEDRNLYAADNPEVAAGEKDLLRYPRAGAVEVGQMESLLNDPDNAETVQRLKSLGYVAGPGLNNRPAQLLDPKDAISIEEDLRQAKESLDKGDVRGGTEALNSVLKRNPDNVYALSMLGLVYLNTGNYEQALICFRKEVRLRPQVETARSNLGTVYKRMGKIDMAQQEYNAELAINPRNAVAASNLAQIYLDKSLLDDARRVLYATVSAGGESADLHFEFGLLEARVSNLDKARSAFTKVLALDPGRVEAYVNLGKIAFLQKRIDESIYQYQRALRLDPHNAGYMATLGSLYLSGKNDPSEALRYFRQALAADPDGPDARNLKELIAGLETQHVK
jgi:choline-sulfatase